VDRAEQTSKRQEQLSRSRAKRSAAQQAHDQANRPWPEAFSTAVETLLGSTYGPVWVRKQRVWVFDDQGGKAVITEGVISKCSKKSKSSPATDVWDVELAGVPDAYRYPAWAIFSTEELASEVLAELRKFAKC